MNDRQLRYALTVWREHSFSKAAEKLNISQPSISQQVRFLEEELGFDLFRRTGRGVEITYIGRTFMTHAEEALSGLHELSDTARQLRGGSQGTFSVGFSSGIAQEMVPRVMRALAPALADIRLNISTATTRRVQRLVFQQRLNLGITIEADPRSAPPDLVRERISSVELALLVPPGHELARHNAPISLEAISGEKLIINEPNIGYGEIVEALFLERGLRSNIAAISDDMDSIKLMVRSGVGLAIAPENCARNEVAAGQLVMLPLHPRQEVAIVLVRRNAPLGVQVETYLTMIRDSFGLTRHL